MVKSKKLILKKNILMNFLLVGWISAGCFSSWWSDLIHTGDNEKICAGGHNDEDSPNDKATSGINLTDLKEQ